MSFDINYFGRWSSTANTRTSIAYHYLTSADTLATVKAAGYFNTLLTQGHLKVGDLISIKASDASDIVVVTSVTTNIEVASYNAAAVVPLYAGEHTTVGGAAAEAITVTGVLDTDLVLVTLHTEGATPRTILTAAATAADTITVTFSGDPAADHVVTYVVYRAL